MKVENSKSDDMVHTEDSIQDKDTSEKHISLKTFYGSNYLLYTVNLGFFCFLILLSIISVTLYSLPTHSKISTPRTSINSLEESESPDLKKLTPFISNRENKDRKDFDIISTKNIFSAARKEWITKPIPKLPPPPSKKINLPPPPKPPVKIVLYGIIMAGNVKKAMINNPKVGSRDNKTIYLEEGDEIEGYKVKGIESDKIILDWQGEDVVLTLYTNPDKEKPTEEKHPPQYGPGK